MTAAPATLRLMQTTPTDQPNHYRIELRLTIRDQVLPTAYADIEFAVSPHDQEDIRWYLEDFLEYPFAPAPLRARRIEARIRAIGETLHRAIFEATDQTRALYQHIRTHIHDLRIEILTDVRAATAIPWELIHDPHRDVPLSVEAASFVRSYAMQKQLYQRATTQGPLRILVVIARPRLDEDVPYRSVASRLLKATAGRQDIQLTVLRPATFEALGQTLEHAKAAGTPYQIVHFDGHGAYGEYEAIKNANSRNIMRADLRTGAHGYLIFEDAEHPNNHQLVSGPELGALLIKTSVSVLILNACRSAQAAPSQPTPNEDQASPPNLYQQVRAIGSLAQEIMDNGVGGVLAMRYNVYVITAAQLVADIYTALSTGLNLSTAVSMARAQLYRQPERNIGYGRYELQDWCVPIVYETEPITLFPQKPASQAAKIEIGPNPTTAAPPTNLLEGIPHPPDVGFIGRDETLLAIDRAFDTDTIVLLHALAGSGKTTTAAEFCRWYVQTDGIQGPILWTSFERYRPLSRVLDDFGAAFDEWLKHQGIHWTAITDTKQRRTIALQVLQRVPVLWIWDNIEPITGFPASTESAWTLQEQTELADFLRALRQTKAKTLLTSRRDERAWLGQLPVRITVPKMPMVERVQLTQAIARKYRHSLLDIEPWRPLLRYTEGNPMTLTIVVGLALRDRRTTADQITAFVTQLRAGEANLDNPEETGKDRSLGASLSYGFTHAFTIKERKILALLHLFQGFVSIYTLGSMSYPDDPWCLPEVRGLSREDAIAVLDRAAEIGLLTAHGNGYYSLHPALPWYFKQLFDQEYQEEGATQRGSTRVAAMLAFAEAMGMLGDFYIRQYVAGQSEVIEILAAEEANLLHAWRLAQTYEWWGVVMSTMQGLRQLYNHLGRQGEWRRLVEAIVPEFVDVATDGPLTGREEQWNLVTEYRVRLAEQMRQWQEAEQLQRVNLNWNRARSQEALGVAQEQLTNEQRNVVRTLAVSLHRLADILRQQGKAECVDEYEKSYALSLHIGDEPGAAICAFNLGHTYTEIAAVRNLAKAKEWYQRSLALRAEGDKLGKGGALGQLGAIALEQFREGLMAHQPAQELLMHIDAALRYSMQALDVLPSNAVDSLAPVHNQLGEIYGSVGDSMRALQHYNYAIRYQEITGNVYRAAVIRFNVAISMGKAERFADAMLYAHAALQGFETFGERAREMIKETQDLIALIEKTRKKFGQ